MHVQCCADIMCFCVIRVTVNRNHTMCMFVLLGHELCFLFVLSDAGWFKAQIWTVFARFPRFIFINHGSQSLLLFSFDQERVFNDENQLSSE